MASAARVVTVGGAFIGGFTAWSLRRAGQGGSDARRRANRPRFTYHASAACLGVTLLARATNLPAP